MIKLYIGSNNVTKVCEVAKIEKILDKTYKGYTIVKSSGVWEGEHEDSVIVSLVEMDGYVLETVIRDLKEELGQDSIMVEIINSVVKFI